MGLDTYAYMRVVVPDDTAKVEFAGINLCGGLCSGGRESSGIRGKVYAQALLEVGLDLYQEDISPQSLRAWYDTLTVRELDRLRENLEDADALMRWLKVCVDNGYGLFGWW